MISSEWTGWSYVCFLEKLCGKPASNKEREEPCRQKTQRQGVFWVPIVRQGSRSFPVHNVVLLHAFTNFLPLLCKAKVVLLSQPHTPPHTCLSSAGEQNELASAPDTWVLHNNG